MIADPGAASLAGRTMQQAQQRSEAPPAPLQVQLVQPFQGPLGSMQRHPTVAELQDLLQQAHDTAQSYSGVQNIAKLCRRILRDLKFLEGHAAALAVADLRLDSSSQQQQQLDQSRLQGIVNNLRGFHGELLAMQVRVDHD